MLIVETLWRMPISVRLHNGLQHTFHSVEDTLDFMENEWPIRYGAHYLRALEFCRAAKMRTASSEAAREVVISACLEANMPLVMPLRPAHRAIKPSAMSA